MGEAEPTWKEYAQAFSDVVEALERVDQFMREQHFTTLDLFRVCDVNDSGSLSKDELVDNFLRIGLPITYGQARHLVNFLDSNNTDEIEYVELDDALKHYRRLRRQYGHGQKYWVRRYLQQNPQEVKDPCFPNHFVDREDFKVAFPRFQARKDPEVEVVEVEAVLHKPKELREHVDLHVTLAFLDTVPVLRTLGTRRLWDLGKRLSMASFRQDDLILKQGSMGKQFYIILGGSVAVQYNRLQMTILRRGDVFGEKALRDQTPTETPTFVALEYTKLACVSSEDYFQYIHEHMQDRHAELSQWMHSHVQVLFPLKKVVVDEAVPFLVPMRVPRGTELFVQGASSVSLFFIRSGTVEIRSTYLVPKVNRLPTSLNRRKYQEVRQRQRLEKTYGTLGPGACFGEDCILGYHDRQYTAVVVSEGGADLLQLRRHQAARSFMRHKDLFLDNISKVYPYFSTPSDERFNQVVAVVEEAKLLKELKHAALGPHYLKRLESSLKLPGIHASSPRHKRGTRRGGDSKKGGKAGAKGKELPEGTQTMSLFEATMTGTLNMTMTGVAGVAGAHTKRPAEKPAPAPATRRTAEKAEVLSAIGHRGPQADKLPAINKTAKKHPGGVTRVGSPRRGGSPPTTTTGIPESR